MPMHDAYACLYRISMLIFKISQLICIDILVSMQYRKSQLIKCYGICIRAFSDVFPMCFMCYLLKNSSQQMHAHWKSCNQSALWPMQSEKLVFSSCNSCYILQLQFK